MNEVASYTEHLYAIMRETKDCDAAAKQLEGLVPAFREIGPRMMKLKERMTSLPQADRDRIKQESEGLVAAMKKRFADADAIEQQGKDCEQSRARRLRRRVAEGDVRQEALTRRLPIDLHPALRGMPGTAAFVDEIRCGESPPAHGRLTDFDHFTVASRCSAGVVDK